MASQITDDHTNLDIDWLKTFAGAMAAVTSAVLLSTLGAVGTIIGAAVGSLAATVGTALYAQGLAKSRATMAKAQVTALSKVGVAQAEVRRAGRADDEASAEAHLDIADERLGQAKAELDEVAAGSTPTPLRDQLARLPWKRVALLAAATFVVVLLTITAFEALTGQSVSSRTGGSGDGQGTTIGGVTENDESQGGPDQDDQAPEPEQPEPSEEPTPSGEPTPSEGPTDEPSETPSEEPTESPAPTPSIPVPTPTGATTQ